MVRTCNILINHTDAGNRVSSRGRFFNVSSLGFRRRTKVFPLPLDTILTGLPDSCIPPQLSVARKTLLLVSGSILMGPPDSRAIIGLQLLGAGLPIWCFVS